MVNREEFKQDSLKTMTDAAIDDYHDRVDEHNIKLLDESYQFSMFEKENLLQDSLFYHHHLQLIYAL